MAVLVDRGRLQCFALPTQGPGLWQKGWLDNDSNHDLVFPRTDDTREDHNFYSIIIIDVLAFFLRPFENFFVL